MIIIIICKLFGRGMRVIKSLYIITLRYRSNNFEFFFFFKKIIFLYLTFFFKIILFIYIEI